MKKKFFGVALIAAMAVAAGWNFNQSKNEVGLSDLAAANIEALANPEGSGNGYTEISGKCSKCKADIKGCLYCTEDPNTCNCNVSPHSC